MTDLNEAIRELRGWQRHRILREYGTDGHVLAGNLFVSRCIDIVIEAVRPSAQEPLLPNGAVVLGPNTVSGLPEQGGSGEWCPPYSDPLFTTDAAKVTVWFRGWYQAIDFVKKLSTPHTTRHDPRTGPCPTCGFQIVEKPRQPFVIQDDDTHSS